MVKKVPKVKPLVFKDATDILDKVDVDTDDVAYFQRNQGYSGFLDGLNPEDLRPISQKSKEQTVFKRPKKYIPSRKEEEIVIKRSGWDDETEGSYSNSSDEEQDNHQDDQEDDQEDLKVLEDDDEESDEDSARSDDVRRNFSLDDVARLVDEVVEVNERDFLPVYSDDEEEEEEEKESSGEEMLEDDDDDDDDDGVAARPSKTPVSKNDVDDRLPTVELDGSVQRRANAVRALTSKKIVDKGKRAREEKDVDEEEHMEESGDDTESEEAHRQHVNHVCALLVPPEGEELPMSDRKMFELAQTRIARACNLIVSDPHEHLHFLTDLQEVLEKERRHPIIRVAILSMFAVFRQILPLSPIRTVYSTEERKVSRQVAENRTFELTMLGMYELYVERLGRVLAHSRSPSRNKAAAARCLGGLLAARPNFNLRSDVLNTLVSAAGVRDEKGAREVCKQLTFIFESDPNGEISLLLVKAINRLLKSKAGLMRPQVLEAMRSARVLESMQEVDVNIVRDGMRNGTFAKRDASHSSRKALRVRKERRLLEKSMRQYSSKKLKQLRTKTYVELLNALFLVYFRVLKHLPDTALLPFALDGVTSHAHQINIEMMNDLISVLHKLIITEMPISTVVKVILAAFRALRNQGFVIDVDIKIFYDRLYALLLVPPMCVHSNTIDANDYCAELLFAVYLAICQGPEHETERAAAFCKRLGSLAMSLSPSQAAAAMMIVEHIVKYMPKVGVMFERDACVGGTHMPWIDDPSHCNALASTMWEGSMLSVHWDPTVQKAAIAMVQRSFPRVARQLTLLTVREKVHGLDNMSRATFDPEVPPPSAKALKRSRSAHAHMEKNDQFVMRGYAEQVEEARKMRKTVADPILPTMSFGDLFRRRKANERMRKLRDNLELTLIAAEQWRKSQPQ